MLRLSIHLGNAVKMVVNTQSSTICRIIGDIMNIVFTLRVMNVQPSGQWIPGLPEAENFPSSRPSLASIVKIIIQC